MDVELTQMLSPYWTPKLNYTATPAAAMLTNVFWDEPVFGAVTVAGQDYLIESIAANEAVGPVYLYRLLVREAGTQAV